MSGMKCSECGVGRLHAVTLPYVRWLGKHMMVLPNAPAARCDMCGEVEFDPYFLVAIDYMFDELARPRQTAAQRQQPVAEQSAAWSRPGRGGEL